MPIEHAAPGVSRLRTLMVNVYFVEHGTGWTLIDTGLPGYAGTIREEAARLFGAGRPPSAIVLTHAHFDHVGSLRSLANGWDVPVYAHPIEHPYLDGRSKYPPPDPTVGGGLLAQLSPLFPRGPIDVTPRLQQLPPDGIVPTLPGWRWIHTPGHTDGHVSLFRDADRVLIAGDAVVATRQESLIDVLAQREVVWRPPAYYTTDWALARDSVRRLANLDPRVLATGHGAVLSGEPMRRALQRLAQHFDEFVPSSGRYVRYPAIADHRGVLHVPPRPVSAASVVAAGLAVGLVAAAVWRANARES